MAILGYARVNTQDQNLTGQLEALKVAGADLIFREKISGARADRPQLAKLMASLKAGDVVLVTKLDRLGRSTRELLDLIERISKAGAAFRSIGDPLWDTSSSQGRLLSTLLAAIAEFERDLIKERTGEGRKRAMANGVKFGRKPKLSEYQRPQPSRRWFSAAGLDGQCLRGSRHRPVPRFNFRCAGTGGPAAPQSSSGQWLIARRLHRGPNASAHTSASACLSAYREIPQTCWGSRPAAFGSFVIFQARDEVPIPVGSQANSRPARYSLVTRRPQYTPFERTEHTNQGRSPPNLHGVQATAIRCSTSLQSSPYERLRYSSITEWRSVWTLIEAIRWPSMVHAHENNCGDRR